MSERYDRLQKMANHNGRYFLWLMAHCYGSLTGFTLKFPEWKQRLNVAENQLFG